MFGDRTPVPFLKTAASEMQGQISPDGKWIAYTSDDSGRFEVYVRSFPAGGAKYPVSNNGGNFPRWRRDGKELFYRAHDVDSRSGRREWPRVRNGDRALPAD